MRGGSWSLGVGRQLCLQAAGFAACEFSLTLPASVAGHSECFCSTSCVAAGARPIVQLIAVCSVAPQSFPGIVLLQNRSWQLVCVGPALQWASCHLRHLMPPGTSGSIGR